MQLELWPESPKVTLQEVHEWVREIGIDPESWRGQYYIRNWDVAGKIAAIKRLLLIAALSPRNRKVSHYRLQSRPHNSDTTHKHIQPLIRMHHRKRGIKS